MVGLEMSKGQGEEGMTCDFWSPRRAAMAPKSGTGLMEEY